MQHLKETAERQVEIEVARRQHAERVAAEAERVAAEAERRRQADAAELERLRAELAKR